MNKQEYMKPVIVELSSAETKATTKGTETNEGAPGGMGMTGNS